MTTNNVEQIKRNIQEAKEQDKTLLFGGKYPLTQEQQFNSEIEHMITPYEYLEAYVMEDVDVDQLMSDEAEDRYESFREAMD